MKACPRLYARRLRAALRLAASCAVPALCWPAGAIAQSSAGNALQRMPAEVRLGFERIELPGNEKLGLVGASYLLEPWPGIRVGPALYGAVTGQRGGFFTFGAEGAWRGRLVGPLSMELGVYVGGGGGANAPVGGGLMWRPHADLLWDFGAFRAGVSASQVRFSNGDISSRQLGFVYSMDTDFGYVGAERIGAPARIDGRSGVGFDRLLVLGGVYRPKAGTLGVSGAPLKRNIAYAGARAEQLLAAPWVWGIEATGAGGNGAAGYAEFLGTVGAETPVFGDRLRLGARVALGMGGGGDVPMGGGLLVKAAAQATARLSRTASVTLEGGMARAPRGDFRAPFAALAFNWGLDQGAVAGPIEATTRQEWSIGTETYRHAARRAGPAHALQNVNLTVTRFVGDAFYLTGQAHSAWGGDAGAYSVGLVGAGYRLRGEGPWFAGAELLAGAAGGGGVDSGDGAIVQPMLYSGYELTPSTALRLGVGRVKARGGELSSPVVDLSLVFAFGAGRP